MKKHKKGLVDTSALNRPPEPHEHKTAKYFSERGFDIVFIRPSNIKGTKSPDFTMAGKNWEVKGPIVYSESSFKDNFGKANKQSENIIFDLRRLSQKDEKIYLKELKKRKTTPGLKTLLIITRDGNLLTERGTFDIIKT